MQIKWKLLPHEQVIIFQWLLSVQEATLQQINYLHLTLFLKVNLVLQL